MSVFVFILRRTDWRIDMIYSNAFLHILWRDLFFPLKKNKPEWSNYMRIAHWFSVTFFFRTKQMDFLCSCQFFFALSFSSYMFDENKVNREKEKRKKKRIWNLNATKSIVSVYGTIAKMCLRECEWRKNSKLWPVIERERGGGDEGRGNTREKKYMVNQLCIE